jgi:FkbM family methyltransferase
MNRKSDKIRSASSHLLRKLGRRLHHIVFEIGKPKSCQNPAVARWFADNGDKTLRLYYIDLHKDSLVFDVGGYEGQWTSDIYSMYRCQVHVFEPVEEFAKRIRDRFFGNPDIIVHQFGLSNRNWTTKMALDKDGTSAFKPGKTLVDAQFAEAATFFADNNIEFIDFMKINIEGGEYDLLDYILKIGWVCNIRNIQIQFHDFIPNAEIRMAEIQQRLSITHELTYQYRFVWENWKLKE